MMQLRLSYQEGASLLHQLHPLVKLAWLVFLTIFVFTAPSLSWLLGLLFLSLAAFPINGFSISRRRGMRLFLTTALLLLFLQLLFNRQGQALWRVGTLAITEVGLQTGLRVASRFMIIILLSHLFVLSTSPKDFAYGLMQAGLPYRTGFALVTALRFAPIFEQEALTIYQAQLARGVQYDRRNIRRLIVLLQQFSLPLLVSIFHKVNALSFSMEGRSFGRFPTRSYYEPIHTKTNDWIAASALVLAALGLILSKTGFTQ